jgi:N-acetylglutamate synthase-like GNAT family acetyltransferase
MFTHKQKRRVPIGVPTDHGNFCIRSFRGSDQADAFSLYRLGVLGGRLDLVGEAPDMADIEKSYFRRPQDHFWIAEAGGSVIGTIAIAEDNQCVMHLRRLRVTPSWQAETRVASGLIKTAIAHARLHGCLKLVFHTALDGPRAIQLLDGLGLQFSRILDRSGQHLIEFYDDLYASLSGEGPAEPAPPAR